MYLLFVLFQMMFGINELVVVVQEKHLKVL